MSSSTMTMDTQSGVSKKRIVGAVVAAILAFAFGLGAFLTFQNANPTSAALSDIEELRVNGSFADGIDIPEGLTVNLNGINDAAPITTVLSIPNRGSVPANVQARGLWADLRAELISIGIPAEYHNQLQVSLTGGNSGWLAVGSQSGPLNLGDVGPNETVERTIWVRLVPSVAGGEVYYGYFGNEMVFDTTLDAAAS